MDGRLLNSEFFPLYINESLEAVVQRFFFARVPGSILDAVTDGDFRGPNAGAQFVHVGA